MLSKFLMHMEEALTRPTFKPDMGVSIDPVPARTAETLPHINTGGGPSVASIRDPVPATAAEEFVLARPFRPNAGFVRDPIPARSL